MLAIFSINMSVHTQERYVHSSHHQFQSLAVASQTQLSSLCDESQLWLIIVLVIFIQYRFSHFIILLSSDSGMSVIVINSHVYFSHHGLCLLNATLFLSKNSLTCLY